MERSPQDCNPSVEPRCSSMRRASPVMDPRPPRCSTLPSLPVPPALSRFPADTPVHQPRHPFISSQRRPTGRWLSQSVTLAHDRSRSLRLRHGRKQFVLNEVTTAASAWALASFMSSGGSVGASCTNTLGLDNAFLTASSLENAITGVSPGAGNPSTLAVSTSKLNTLANALSSCTVSSGGAACSSLFSAAVVRQQCSRQHTRRGAQYRPFSRQQRRRHLYVGIG